MSWFFRTHTAVLRAHLDVLAPRLNALDVRWILFDLGGKWTFPIRVGGTLHLIAVGDGSTWREGAEQLRQEIDDDRRKAEAEAAQTPTNARAEASSTAGVDGAPTLQYYVGGSGCPEHKPMEQPTA